MPSPPRSTGEPVGEPVARCGRADNSLDEVEFSGAESLGDVVASASLRRVEPDAASSVEEGFGLEFVS